MPWAFNNEVDAERKIHSSESRTMAEDARLLLLYDRHVRYYLLDGLIQEYEENSSHYYT